MAVSVDPIVPPLTVISTPPPGAAKTTRAFALSGAVIGMTSTGVNFFVLLYYNQVLGLKPALAGLALALALIVDAFADPLVGVISDGWRSRLGRRHPFLYASILPMGAAYLALWFPPFDGDRQWALFSYLLVITACLRLSISCFDVPSNALIPELTRDYEHRTRYASAKTCVSWLTASFVSLLMYYVWLRDPQGSPKGSGMFNQSGFEHAAIWIAAAVLLAASLVPITLRGWIPFLKLHPPVQSRRPTAVIRDIVSTYSNPSLRALLLSAIFFATGSGLKQSLWVYFITYFWLLSGDQVVTLQLGYLAAATLAWFLLPVISRGADKRRLILLLASIYWIFDLMPVTLRLIDLMPQSGSAALLPTLVAFAFLDGLLANMVLSLLLSMLTDVVEDNLLRTNRREEGLVLAGQTLVTKSCTALGTILGATLLTLVQFPRGVPPASVGAEVLSGLGSWYIGLLMLLGILSTFAISRYKISRQVYVATVATLDQRNRTDMSP